MKHKISAVVAISLLAAALAVVVWISFARTDPDGGPPGGAHPAAGEHPTPAPSPSFTVPSKRVDPLRATTYCQTAKLLGIYAHQPYGLDPDLGVVSGRSFSKRLHVVAKTYQRLAVQAARTPEAAAAEASWRRLAAVVGAAAEKLEVTGYDVQSQVMILELAEVAKASQTHLPRATATLVAACGITREALGL